MDNNQSQQLDPSILALTKAIGQQESGGNYDFSKVGPDGERGAYQMTPAWIQANAPKYLGVGKYDPNNLTPAQQDELAYKVVEDRGKAGLTPAQIASEWNSGNPEAYKQKHVGTSPGGAHYDTPGYVNSVEKYYNQFSQQNQQGGYGYITPPKSNPVVPTAEAATSSATSQNSQPESLGHKALDVAKGVGNFLFPIVGDVYHDIKGDNKKTFLQQLGDTATSALPFIPGLGEVGEAARGAEIAGEVGTKVAGEAGTDLASKLASKFSGSTVAKGAATGYGAGVASSLSQGKGLGESILPNANNLIGAATGGTIPALIHGGGAFAKSISGISPQIETELSKMGSEANPADLGLFNKYISAAKEHATNLRSTSPLTMAADTLDEAAGQVQKKVDEAGSAVGAAKKAGANLPLHPLVDVGNQFANHVEEKYGLALTSDEAGKVTATPIQGSKYQVPTTDVKRIENIATQLNDLHNSGSTVKQATEVMDNLNKLVDHSKADLYGHTNDPLEGLIKDTAGNLNKTIRKSSPALAAANDTFSGLKGLQDEISGMAGKNLNKGELLMRRVFSGDKSGDVQDLFAKIKDATGIDLVKHAVLAKNAIETVGSKADKTLLQQAIEGGVSGKQGLASSVINMAKGAAQKTFANPERIGRNLVTGKNPGLLKDLITKGAIRASQAVTH